MGVYLIHGQSGHRINLGDAAKTFPGGQKAAGAG
jgi:hypothetical protein